MVSPLGRSRRRLASAFFSFSAPALAVLRVVKERSAFDGSRVRAQRARPCRGRGCSPRAGASDRRCAASQVRRFQTFRDFGFSGMGRSRQGVRSQSASAANHCNQAVLEDRCLHYGHAGPVCEEVGKERIITGALGAVLSVRNDESGRRVSLWALATPIVSGLFPRAHMGGDGVTDRYPIVGTLGVLTRCVPFSPPEGREMGWRFTTPRRAHGVHRRECL